MGYDFDKITDRKGTKCLKYDFATARGKKEGLISMWVADMDFPTAPEILESLRGVVDHGIFGYTESDDAYYESVAGWYRTHFEWEPRKEWLIKTPGVVFALSAAIRAFTKEGEAVLIQQPVYYPFSEVIVDNGRKPVDSPLVLKGDHYEIDFDDFERKVIEERVKLFILCSPHNPVGRVWKEWELRRIGEICVAHDVIVASDEIHSDFVWEGNKHTVFASLDPAFAERSITCTAPSKTFNLAGLQASNIFVPNRRLRLALKKSIAATGYSQLNTMALFACEAAYTHGDKWLGELKEYLQGNIKYFNDFLERELPMLHLIKTEGTYLLWVDFRELGLTELELEDLIVNRAGLWLDSGAMFGKVGEGFERFNIACPRSVLAAALEQLKRAVLSLKAS
ncbi:MAG: pyridoxal phosphate-dependent aminotransferase [Lachnospiraceae bacterium]|nr:pyridoxal phosphate-dependent aminotransferase [Lachnospiraceae bacterium]